MESCDACGFTYATVGPGRIAENLRHYASVLDRWLQLGEVGAPEWTAALTGRPSPDVWSPLEYAGHLLLVTRAQLERVNRAIAEDTPDFTPIAFTDRMAAEAFNNRNPEDLRSKLTTATDELADLFATLTDEQLERTGIYHWPVRAERTMAWVGRHTIHEFRHHIGDIGSLISQAGTFGPNLVASEHVSLLAWLEFDRASLAEACVGASEASLKARSVPTSTLSLLGLVRHLTIVEQYWFEEIWLGLDVDDLYVTDDDPDGDFNDTASADIDEALERWHNQCAVSRRVVSDVRLLDQLAAQPRRGRPINLRWILIHMIEEYAQHNGHADLLRELADGTTRG
jgi:uncharacterized damage-inducible protein DinB